MDKMQEQKRKKEKKKGLRGRVVSQKWKRKGYRSGKRKRRIRRKKEKNYYLNWEKREPINGICAAGLLTLL